MPRQNGIELVAALRQLEPALPAVVASGYVADAAAAARTLEVRVSYLAKPYGVTELRDALDDALDDALAVDTLHD
jgi:CheY-like chemotaxis protein